MLTVSLDTYSIIMIGLFLVEQKMFPLPSCFRGGNELDSMVVSDMISAKYTLCTFANNDMPKCYLIAVIFTPIYLLLTQYTTAICRVTEKILRENERMEISRI